MSSAIQTQDKKALETFKARSHQMPAHQPLTASAFKSKMAASENNVRGYEYLTQQAREAASKITAEIAWEGVNTLENKYVQAQLKTAQEGEKILVEENHLEIAKLEVVKTSYQVDQANEQVNQEEWKLRQEQYKTGQEYVKTGIEHDKLASLVDRRTLLARQLQQANYQLELSISEAEQGNLIEADYLDVTGMLAPGTSEASEFAIRVGDYQTPMMPTAPKMAVAND